jgi:hypothetical protein
VVNDDVEILQLNSWEVDCEAHPFVAPDSSAGGLSSFLCHQLQAAVAADVVAVLCSLMRERLRALLSEHGLLMVATWI